MGRDPPNPYAAVLDDAARTSRCDHTFAKPSDAAGRYFDARARRWRATFRETRRSRRGSAGYKEECASLVACAPRVPPATVRLAARVLWRRAREAAAADGSNDDDDDEMIEDGVAAAAALGRGRGYDAVDALGDHCGTPTPIPARRRLAGTRTAGAFGGVASDSGKLHHP